MVISLIRQLEKEHSLKVEAMKKTIEESVTEKGDVGFVDQRMN